MPYLYILKNAKGRYYTGITTTTPHERLNRHNRGYVHSTKSGKPWSVIYNREFDSLIKARALEKQIKSWRGGNAFRKFLSRTAESSNGRTPPFGGDYLGPNPSSAALDGTK